MYKCTCTCIFLITFGHGLWVSVCLVGLGVSVWLEMSVGVVGLDVNVRLVWLGISVGIFWLVGLQVDEWWLPKALFILLL